MPNVGAAAQLCVDAALPIDASSQPIEFVSCGLKKMESIVHSGGIRGTRERNIDRQRLASHAAGGPISLQPTATEIDWFLPYILGGATAGGVTSIGESLTEFYACVDKVEDVATYEECVVASASFAGAQGGPIELSMQIEAKQEDMDETASFPSLTYGTEDMFVLADATVTIAGSAREISRFRLTIDNGVDAGRFMNSLYRDQKPAHDCVVTFEAEFPQDVNADLIEDGADGVAFIFALADGTDTYTFTTGKATCQPVSAEIAGRAEIMLPLTFELFRDGATSQLTVTKT